MAGRLLFLISGDPRLSPRPAEAVRIAAGLLAGNRFQEVNVLLRGPAVIVTRDLAAAELMDEEILQRHLPGLSARGSLYLERAAGLEFGNDPREIDVRELDEREVVNLVAASDHILNFT